MASKINVDKIARGSGTPEFTIPTADGTAKSALITDGGGVLSFATGTPSNTNFLRGDGTWQTVTTTALTGSTNNTIPTVTGANALTGEANLTYDGTSLGVKNAGTASDIKVYCETANSHYTSIKSAAHAAYTGGSWTMTLPGTDGTASQFLQTDGAGATTWAAAGGLKLITSETNNSAVASWNFGDCFSTTYDVYFVTISHLMNVTSSQETRLKIGVSNLSSVESFGFTLYERNVNTNEYQRNSNSASYIDLNNTCGSGEPGSASFWIYNPFSSTLLTSVVGQSVYYHTGLGGNSWATARYGGMATSAASSASMQFTASSGNLGSATTGIVARVSIYGLAES